MDERDVLEGAGYAVDTTPVDVLAGAGYALGLSVAWAMTNPDEEPPT